MAQEQNLRNARRFHLEVVGEGKIDLIDELLAPEFVEHEIAPGLPEGREGVKAWVEMIRQGFPDIQMEILDGFEQGDKVVLHALARGTHTGEFMGIEPTGKEVEVRVIDIIRFENGKTVEHWGVTDLLGLMQQIGHEQAPPAPGIEPAAAEQEAKAQHRQHEPS